MKRSLVPAVLLSLVIFSSLSCSKINPSGPGPGPGGGGGGNTNGPMILASITRQTINSSSNTACQVLLMNAQSTPIAGGAVTLVTPGNVQVPLTESTTGYFDNIASVWSYQPGQNYTVKVSVGGKNYSGSISLPGGVTVPASGTPISWSKEGLVDIVTVTETSPNYALTLNTTTSTTNANSPVNASGAYPDIPGTYQVAVNITKVITSAFPNAYPGATITGTDQFQVTINK